MIDSKKSVKKNNENLTQLYYFAAILGEFVSFLNIRTCKMRKL
jgi:hypothetical protein